MSTSRRCVPWESDPHVQLLAFGPVVAVAALAGAAGKQAGHTVVAIASGYGLAFVIAIVASVDTYTAESKRARRPWVRYVVSHFVFASPAAFLWVRCRRRDGT